MSSVYKSLTKWQTAKVWITYLAIWWAVIYGFQEVAYGIGGEPVNNPVYEWGVIIASWVIAWIVAGEVGGMVRERYQKLKSLTEMYSGT